MVTVFFVVFCGWGYARLGLQALVETAFYIFFEGGGVLSGVVGVNGGGVGRGRGVYVVWCG